MWVPGRLVFVIFWSQFVCILFYGLFVEYGEGVNANTKLENEKSTTEYMNSHYPMYMDIHVMVFVGFGFLMTFLKHNSWTAVGFTYLIACWAIQICVLATGFWKKICYVYVDKVDGFNKI